MGSSAVWVLAFAAAAATVQSARAGTTCDALAAMPAAPVDEASAWTEAIWSGVARAHTQIDPGAKSPTLRLVAGGNAAGAWYCRGRDTIYVDRAFVDYGYAGRGSDGGVLLAFALAHELAHRRFDAGDHGFSGACPDSDPAIEARADRRAALLLALADDPTTRRRHAANALVSREALRAFFEAELGWEASCPALTARTAAVEAALGRISRLSRDYDLALTLVAAAGAGLDAAVTALAALHESAGGGGPDGTWDALPELGLLRAQAHVQRAAAVGWCPAGAPLRGLDPDPCTLACTIITPGRARVAPAVADVPRRAQIDVATERVMAHLLLAGARARGVPDADLAGTEACLAYLEGAPERAAQALERIGVGASARARAALRDNRRLFALQSWLLIRDVTARPSRDELLALASTWAWDDTPARAALAVWLDPARRSKAKAEPSPPTPGSAWRPAALCAGDTCLRVRAGPSMLELAPLALDASGRRLATWTSACDLAAPVVTYEGATRVAARCGEPATDWVLELMGDDVRAATALRTTP